MLSASYSPSPDRFICIHGHFYQPPRENPWLETVETQDSAAPYHDWNQRITAECYAANGAARIVDGENRIVRIVNNYARISHNFGPTLLSWMEEQAPLTYRMILQADRLSQARFSGHGCALAQVYNHVIMPLASRADRETQILWGIADFERRYRRRPEGMWLAETAVDVETLDLLAQHGIRFTILAPHQCARMRRMETASGPRGSREPWTETPQDSVDTTRPYQVRLPEGRSIDVFFYDGPLSRAIAFERLLNSGDAFAQRLSGGFRPHQPGPQLVHVATDGESYGHHHRHGEMALAYALQKLETQNGVRLTNYGEFLEMFPPSFEAEIQENTAWSCFHGVERWRSNCGCGSGSPGFTQEWREPLRNAFDWLRDGIVARAADSAGDLFLRFRDARNDFIHVIHDRSRASVDAFFARHAIRALSPQERTRALKLMEMERHALLMYTSCGWFFDELSGIETVQIMAYAARALELSADVLGLDKATLEEEFIERLSRARSNVPQWADGATLYRQQIQPMAVGLEQVVAHFAISSVFAEKDSPGAGSREPVFCYTLERLRERSFSYGTGQLLLGRVCARSRITEESEAVTFAVLHFGDQNLTAAARRSSPGDEKALLRLEVEADQAIAAADLPRLVHLLDQSFGGSSYSLTSLFRDEQRRILRSILRPTLESAESSLTAIYTQHASLLNYISRTTLPKPPWLRVAAQFAIHAQLRRAMAQEHIDSERILLLLEHARTDMVVLDIDSLELQADERMREVMLALERSPGSIEAVESALALAEALHALPFALNQWEAQNIWYDLDRLTRAAAGTPVSSGWREKFNQLGRRLSINVERIALDGGEHLSHSGHSGISTAVQTV